MEVLRRYGPLLRLPDLADALNKGTLPRRSIAVTFDDGYSDWFQLAKPLLEHLEIPATVFLITGTNETKRLMWWDELENILLRSQRLRDTLELRISGRTHSWSLGDSAHFPEGAQTYASWKASDDPPTPRHAIYFELWTLLRPLAEGERQLIMNELRAWAGADSSGDGGHRLLSPQEIVSSAKSNLFDMGAHTGTHPLLSAISSTAQREEIRQSKSYLEKLMDRPVASFAFPYGDYNAETLNILRDEGFTCACGTKSGSVRADTNWFELPRMHVLDWDGRTFEKRLTGWFSSL